MPGQLTDRQGTRSPLCSEPQRPILQLIEQPIPQRPLQFGLPRLGSPPPLVLRPLQKVDERIRLNHRQPTLKNIAIIAGPVLRYLSDGRELVIVMREPTCLNFASRNTPGERNCERAFGR